MAELFHKDTFHDTEARVVVICCLMSSQVFFALTPPIYTVYGAAVDIIEVAGWMGPPCQWCHSMAWKAHFELCISPKWKAHGDWYYLQFSMAASVSSDDSVSPLNRGSRIIARTCAGVRACMECSVIFFQDTGLLTSVRHIFLQLLSHSHSFTFHADAPLHLIQSHGYRFKSR